MKLFLSSALAAWVFLAPAQALNKGWASYYKMGRITASGEVFQPMGMTAAHRQLPFGTKLKVTNLRNGRFVVVRINDRGPFIRGRILDLSMGAAQAIGLTVSGVGEISYSITP